MFPILIRQNIKFKFFVINQIENGQFNRAKLLNIGFAEAAQTGEFDCFIFHDVDLVLENDKGIYSCKSNPQHLSGYIDKFHYKIPYNQIFGGGESLIRRMTHQ